MYLPAPGCPNLKLELTEGLTVDTVRDQNSGTPIAYTYRYIHKHFILEKCICYSINQYYILCMYCKF